VITEFCEAVNLRETQLFCRCFTTRLSVTWRRFCCTPIYCRTPPYEEWFSFWAEPYRIQRDLYRSAERRALVSVIRR